MSVSGDLTPPPAARVVPGRCSAAGAGPGGLCGAGAQVYGCGWRCEVHAPWAAGGRPKPEPGPGWPAGAWSTPSPQSASAVVDQRAVASGKRRAAPHTYRAAQAAVTGRPVQHGLAVDLGLWDDKACRWVRYPSADYRCPYGCGFTDSASGDAVRHFAADIETRHRASCPAASPKEHI